LLTTPDRFSKSSDPGATQCGEYGAYMIPDAGSRDRWNLAGPEKTLESHALSAAARAGAAWLPGV
jgi:hypothetical protein